MYTPPNVCNQSIVHVRMKIRTQASSDDVRDNCQDTSLIDCNKVLIEGAVFQTRARSGHQSACAMCNVHGAGACIQTNTQASGPSHGPRASARRKRVFFIYRRINIRAQP